MTPCERCNGHGWLDGGPWPNAPWLRLSVSCPDCGGVERAQDDPPPRSDLDAVDAVRAEVAQIEEAT